MGSPYRSSTGKGCAGTVEKLQGEGPAPRPLYLQGHGNKVEFRNIWVKEKE